MQPYRAEVQEYIDNFGYEEVIKAPSYAFFKAELDKCNKNCLNSKVRSSYQYFFMAEMLDGEDAAYARKHILETGA